MPENIKLQEITNGTITLALDTIKNNKQAIIFVNTKRGAEKTSEDIAKKIKEINPKLEELSEKILKAVSKPTKQCQRLAFCVKKGTAFHHSGLVAKQRELIEDSFKEGLIKIISATPTLAAGVDLPAYRVIMKDLKRFGHRGMQYIPVLEYLQMTGRAGRPSYDKEGQAICVASSEFEAEEIEERYINGEPEDIYSKLAVEPVLRTYLLSLISARFLKTKDKILDFFSKTFWAYQFEDMDKLKFIIEKMLHQLETWEFIKSTETNDGFLSADEYGVVKYNATLMGKRIAELYLDPYTANHIITCMDKVVKKDIIPFSFLQMISHTLEMRPLLPARNKDAEMIEDVQVEYDSYILDKELNMFDFEYQEYMSSIKTALFFQNWIDETDEEFLLEKFNIRPGEIKAKLDIAEWLLYSTEEICRIKNQHSPISEIRKLRTRLKYGAKEEILALLKLKGVGRIRARALFRNGIKDLGDVKKTDFSKLSQILGKKIAENVTKQVKGKVEKKDTDLGNY